MGAQQFYEYATRYDGKDWCCAFEGSPVEHDSSPCGVPCDDDDIHALLGEQGPGTQSAAANGSESHAKSNGDGSIDIGHIELTKKILALADRVQRFGTADECNDAYLELARVPAVSLRLEMTDHLDEEFRVTDEMIWSAPTPQMVRIMQRLTSLHDSISCRRAREHAGKEGLFERLSGCRQSSGSGRQTPTRSCRCVTTTENLRTQSQNGRQRSRTDELHEAQATAAKLREENCRRQRRIDAGEWSSSDSTDSDSDSDSQGSDQ
jgi:hypothetical protein